MQIGAKLGEGGEAEVFALDDDRVLRRVPLWWMPMHDDARLRHWIVGRLST